MDDLNLNFDDLRWVSEPVVAAERVDLLGLDDSEVFTYAQGLQHDAAWLRTLLHETLTLLHRATVQADRYRRRIEELLAELRACRAEVSRLRAILPARGQE
jgi:hypothetical protein